MPIFQHAHPDPPQIEALFRNYTGRLAFDVGGNVGWAASLMSEKFGKVVSFEPAIESYECLIRNVDLDAVTAYNIAISSEDGTVELTEFSAHLAQGQLATANVSEWLDKDEGEREGSWGHVVGTRVVECITLVTAAERYGVPDLIKCDVEGHEVEVFRGGLDLVAQHRPRLYIEVHGKDLGVELMEWLAPIYGDQIHVVLHPNYRAGSWEASNHYWLVSDNVIQ